MVKTKILQNTHWNFKYTTVELLKQLYQMTNNNL